MLPIVVRLPPEQAFPQNQSSCSSHIFFSISLLLLGKRTCGNFTALRKDARKFHTANLD